MAKRLSLLSGRIEEIPDAPAKPPVEVEPDDEEIAAILAMIMPILQGES